MKLWFLSRKGERRMDCIRECVIRAETAKKAREMAASNCMDEGQDVWLNASLSTCKRLKEEGAAKMIMYYATGF